MQTFELVSEGLKVVSNKIGPRRMTKQLARGLNAQLKQVSSLRWIPRLQADLGGYKRPDGRNSDGFNLGGFDAAGYDSDGFNSDGVDVAGFDPDMQRICSV